MTLTKERVESFFAFMVKRERLRLQKNLGLPFPWTDDPILRDFKFTNVKREHDRTTQMLVNLHYSHQRGDRTLLRHVAVRSRRRLAHEF
jgi:hypothetical protein